MQKILVVLFLLSNFVNAQVDIELPELGDRVSGAISEAEVELLSCLLYTSDAADDC